VREIPLTKGYVALVSDEDYERVSRFKWYADVGSQTVYGRRTIRNMDGKRTQLGMHRFVMGVTDPNIEVDHRDHNGLNNQQENLRVSSRSQNMSNTRKQQGTSSQFKGVSLERSRGKWQVVICVNKKQKHLGYFTDEVEAAMFYDDAARRHFGAFALTNFPEVVVEPCQDYLRAA
jgi:hypothetical protein